MIDDLHNTIICGDCLDVLKTLPDKCVDLVLTSPPYNMGKGKSLGYQPNSSVGQSFYGGYQDDLPDTKYCDWCVDVVRQCLRVSRYVFWNVQFVRSTRGMILRIQNEFWGNLKDIFIWRKQAVSNITAKQGGMAKGWEYVFMFGENNKSTFEYNNFPSNGYVPNIQEFYKEEFFSNHHATFPKKLAGYFIRYFTKENDLVLDIFNGVGTTTAACEQWNRRWIGIDIIPEYCEIARKRIAEEKDKMALFV